MIGRTIGHYRISQKIGEGGMGEVYRATDSRLNREVAVKILPEIFAMDSQRLLRFQREAQVLATLNHPNIGAIYGLEDDGDLHALILELIEGQTLEETIAQQRLPLAKAIEIASQIATALEAAHERGIVHRDLKPANIKITPEGQVKVLDFGLAKAAVETLTGQDVSESPTLTMQATQAGIILGTAAYMSPEQASGRSVDKRTDIWAFGCVLYELLAGERAMPGESLAEVMGSVTRIEPDWSKLPSGVPPRIRLLLKRCFQKDFRQRLRDIGDARIELSEAFSEAEEPAQQATRRSAGWLPWGLALALALLAAAGWLTRSSAPSIGSNRSPTRLTMNLDADSPLLLRSLTPGFALSSDGRRMAYVARRPGGTVLEIRQLDQYQARPLPGTEGAMAPFFSPDSRWVAYFAEGRLKKVPIDGGAPVSLADAPSGSGGYWADDGSIYFSPRHGKPLSRTSAAGGSVSEVTSLNMAEADDDHFAPQLLPGGKAFLYRIDSSSLETRRLAVQKLGETGRKILLENADWARFITSPRRTAAGHLLYLEAETLFAAPFDVASLEITAPAIPVLEGIRGPHLDLAEQGTLAYVEGKSGETAGYSLVWVDRSGAEEPITDTIRNYEDLDLSPDGRRLAFTVEDSEAHVWLLDIERNVASRFVVEGESRDPVWTNSGRYVAYGTKRGDRYGLHRKRFDGGPEETLFLNDVPRWVDPVSWDPNDTVLLFSWFHPESFDDIWKVAPGDPENPRAVLRGPDGQWGAKVSPDGRWLVYCSGESGQFEVYVEPFPEGGTRWQISTGGGTNAIWSPDGTELFYRNEDKMMLVPVQTRPTFSPASPRLLFEGPYRISGRDFDVTPDGKRFVMMKSQQPPTGERIRIVLDWSQELERLVPIDR